MKQWLRSFVLGYGDGESILELKFLEKAEFKKFDRKNTTDGFVSYLKEKHEVLGIEEDVHVIRLLDSGKGFHVVSLIHELLHVYRPKDSEKDIKQTQEWLFWDSRFGKDFMIVSF